MQIVKYGAISLAVVGVLIIALLQVPQVSNFVYSTVGNAVETTTLTVVEDTVEMSGVINAKTYTQFLQMAEAHPGVSTIVMTDVEGSIDDETNLRLSTWVAARGYTTVVKPESEIASGGTDFFLAGKQRIVHEGARIGVHSWSDGEVEGGALPPDHPNHHSYIDFFVATGMTMPQAEDFYFFTIHSAPADGMHWMSKAEMERYGVFTSFIPR